jgi:hypothetical protein
MKSKFFNNLLVFSLFGIALGFFGMLYEGVLILPNMLDTSMARILFWRDYYAVINPVVYYIPLTPLATVVLAGLYFRCLKEDTNLRKYLGWAVILQVATLAITFYMVKQINLKTCFGNIAAYADVIPAKVMLANILSVVRLMFAAVALTLTFKVVRFSQLQLMAGSTQCD